MVSSQARTVREYLAGLPADRRAAIEGVREVIVGHLPRGYEEGIQFGMLGYYVPLSRYPDTYNGHPLLIAGLAAQKSYNTVYLMGVYADESERRWFEGAFARAGKKLDMGKSCVHFRALTELPLEVIGEAIARYSVEDYLARYEAIRASTASAKKKSKAPAKKKPARKARA